MSLWEKDTSCRPPTDNYVYRNVTKQKIIKGTIADDVNANHLEFQIMDIGGRSLETVLDTSGNRRSIKDTLISIEKDPDTMTKKRLLFSRTVIISQEPTRYPVNNPIEEIIDNQEFLGRYRAIWLRVGV